MSYEQYLEMCAQMGWEPREEEAPIDFSTLSEESQHAINIFSILPDNIEGMSGSWLGKDFSALKVFMDIYEIDNRKEVLDRFFIVYQVYSEYYREQRKIQESKSKNSAKVRR